MTKFIVCLCCLCVLLDGLSFQAASRRALVDTSGRLASEATTQKRKRRRKKHQTRTQHRRESARRASEEAPREGMNVQALDTLIAKAQIEGSVRVIVGLRVPFKPEGELDPEDARAQRKAIARAQDALLARLSPYVVNSIRKFEAIPFIALTVDTAALRRIKASPDVASIEEDTSAPPT